MAQSGTLDEWRTGVQRSPAHRFKAAPHHPRRTILKRQHGAAKALGQAAIGGLSQEVSLARISQISLWL